LTPLLVALLACSDTDQLTGDSDPGSTPASDDTGATAAASTPGAGELVVTEIMNDPGAVDGDFGEWIELWNATARTLDLEGIEVTDDDGVGFVIEGPLPVGADGRLVLGVSDDTAVNGGVPVDYAYDVELVKLGNDDDAVILRADGVTVDAVAYDPVEGFPAEEGASKSLSPLQHGATANDAATAWCVASSTYGAGDRGTPGAGNDACP